MLVIVYIILLPQYGIQDTFTAWGESKKYNVGGRRYDIVFEAAIAAELECQRIANEIGFECVIEELIIDDGSDINGIILNGKEFDYFSVTYKNKLISPEGVEFKFSPTVYLRNGEMEISMPGIYEFFVIVSNGGIAIYKGKPHIDTTHYSEKRLLYAEFAQEFAQGKIGYLAPKTGTGKFGLGIGGYDSFDENWGQWYYIDSPIYYYD